MALIRGLNGLCPCTRCLIQKDQQGDISKTAPLRTAVEMKRLVLEARRRQNNIGEDSEEGGGSEEEEDILQSNGLRDVDVRLPSIIMNITTNCIPCRMSSGGSETQIRTPPYLSIGSTISPAAYFMGICGRFLKCTSMRYLGKNALQLTKCTYVLTSFAFYYLQAMIEQIVYLAGEV